LTDTFQLGETDDVNKLFSEMFPQNSQRVQRQKNTPITVIMGNPPYSVGQKSTNDNATNQSYPSLEKNIEKTYIANTKATQKKSLYDAYIKAFRWSSDRLKNNDGIIAFVTNGAWLDSSAGDGFRKSLEKEFSNIYVFNLRGNQRTSGELSRKEGGKIFGGGSRTPIAITILVKKENDTQSKAKIHYHDIGDYLTREQKLDIVKKFGSISNVKLSELSPKEHGDWLNQRNNIFETLIPLASDKKGDKETKSFFVTHSLGTATNRDSWVFNFSKPKLIDNIKKTINFFNQQKQDLQKELLVNKDTNIDEFITYDLRNISWTYKLKNLLRKGENLEYNSNSIILGSHRPFNKEQLYFDNSLNEVVGTIHFSNIS
jgi:predicted helicase